MTLRPNAKILLENEYVLIFSKYLNHLFVFEIIKYIYSYFLSVAKTLTPLDVKIFPPQWGVKFITPQRPTGEGVILYP